jgi:hypothetical protein
MSRTSVTLSISRILPLVLALAAVFIWATVAQAQTEAQTYTPVDTSVAAADTSAGGSGTAVSPMEAAAPGAEGGGAAESGVLGISLLPSTGGPLLPLIGLGAIALGATGLLARHRYSRR